MGKSKGKHILMNNYSNRFLKRLPANKSAKVLISDMLSFLFNSFSEKRDTSYKISYKFSGEQLLRKMQRKIIMPLAGTATNTHVVLFDKSDFTPITKNATGTQNSEKTEREKIYEDEAARLHAARDGIINTHGENSRGKLVRHDAPLPHPWRAVMEDRVHMRRWVVREIIASLLDENHPCGVPRDEVSRHLGGKTMVFDGHCMSLAELEVMEGYKGFDPQVISGPTTISIYDTPITVSFGEDGSRNIYLSHAYSNAIGESDFTAFFYGRLFAECRKVMGGSDGVVLINSCDVDLCYLSIIFEAKMRTLNGTESYGKVVMCNYSGDDIIQCLESDQGGGDECCGVVEVAGLVDDICSTFPHFGESDCERVLSFACAMVCGGSDYTEKIDFVTHDSFWNAIECHHQYIGRLAVFTQDAPHVVRISGGAFSRLLKAAFCEGYKNKNRKPFKGFTFKNMDTDYVTRLVEECNPKNPERHFPSSENVMARAGNLMYYAQMMWQIGDQVLDIAPPHMLHLYGYAPISGGEQDISKGNIRRVCSKLQQIKKRKASKPLIETTKKQCYQAPNNNGSPFVV